jgi:hypothetical protein
MQLGIAIKNSLGKTIKDTDLEARLKNDPNFFKAIKFWMPLVTYTRILDCDTPLHIQAFPAGLPSICSDNPIIFQSEKPDIYGDDFIFPLTKDIIYFRCEKFKNILSTIKIDIDCIILQQARKYVTCTDPKYVYLLNQYFKKNYSNLKELKNVVFGKLNGTYNP